MAYEINTCPRCEEEKKEYVLRYCGTSSTLMSSDRFAKNRVWHNHDPNKHTSEYRCSNGHTIVITYYRVCNICGFNSDRGLSKVEIFDNRKSQVWIGQMPEGIHFEILQYESIRGFESRCSLRRVWPSGLRQRTPKGDAVSQILVAQ